MNRQMKKVISIILTFAITLTSSQIVFAAEDTGENQKKTGAADTVMAESLMPEAEGKVTGAPDYDIWLANTLLYGYENGGNGLYPTFQSFSDPVYMELGGYLLDDVPLVSMSTAWSVYFNSEYRNQFANEQKYIYEVILMEYLKYDSDYKGIENELENNEIKFSMELYNTIAEEIPDDTLDYIKDMTVEEAIDFYKKTDMLNKIDSVISELQDVLDNIDNAIELINVFSEYMALQQVRDERVYLLKTARNSCAASSHPNSDFIKAADELISIIEGSDLQYVQGKTLDYLWGQMCDNAWEILCDRNPILDSIELGVLGLDVCFDSTNVASNNLKLALLYTTDHYLKLGMMSAASDYMSNASSVNAQTFLACFQAYAQFQMYGNDFSKTWLEGYLDSGAVANVINMIFYRENISTAKELIERSDMQTSNRKGVLELIDKYAKMYQQLYEDSDWKEMVNNTNVPVTGVSFPNSQETLKNKNSIFVTYANIEPANATNKNITYTSSDPSILSVPENGGFATIKGSGTVTLEAKTEDGGFVATQTVTVGTGTSLSEKDSGSCGKNVRWTLFEDGTLYIYGNGAMYDFYLENRDAPWDSYSRFIKKVNINSGVTKIGKYAFDRCSSLTSVNIPEGVTSIGEGAFERCSSLTSVSIPEGVTSIGAGAFERCSSLTNVAIPEGVTSIGYETFKKCSNLTSVTIPEGIISIEYGAFSECSSLTNVTIPKGVTELYSTFWGCSSLKSVTIPEGVTELGFTFTGCSSLTSVTIPEGVTSIGNATFSGCSSLTSVTIPKGVTSIEDHAFERCSSLTSVTIPEGVTSIGWETFRGCSSLTSVTIPEGVTCIETQAFLGCSSLTSVTIPKGVTSIGPGAFLGCSSLTNVTIPEEVTCIENETFKECSSLKSVTIPEGVTSIEYEAFADCSSLTSVTIPKGVTSIENGAFSGCSSLRKVIMKGNAPSVENDPFEGLSASCVFYVPKDATGYDTYPWSNYRVVYGTGDNYTITYNANGGKNAPASQKKTGGKTLTLSKTTPTRTGYTFLGWATDKTASKVNYKAGASFKTDKDTTLYAVWKPITYKIAFHANGGTGKMGAVFAIYDKTAVLSANTFKRTGYKFNGWNKKSDGSGTAYTDKASVKSLTSKADDMVTLYAQWIKVKHTITYNLNGGKNSAKNPAGYYATTSTIKLKNPTRTGYTFKGWYADSKYKKKVTQIKKGSTGAKKLYAKWSANVYKVRYVKNGGKGRMSDSTSMKYGKKYTLRKNKFQRKGYTFAGWATAKNGKVIYKNKAKVKNLSSKNGSVKVLYAKWSKVKYRITYKLNGGKNSAKNPASYYAKTSTIKLHNPTRSGYTFKGWYADSKYKKKVTQITKKSTGAKKLYAKWSANVYTVRYDKNGGTGSMADSTSMKYGTVYTLRANGFQRKGYTFIGWTTVKDGNVSYKDKAKVKNLSSENGSVKVLYAKWSPNVYTVRYDKNGGTGSMTDSTAMKYGTEYALQANTFQREGYVFAGWADTRDGEVIYQDNAKVKNLSNVNGAVKMLYAQWNPVVKSITLSENAAIVTVGKSIQLTATIAPDNAIDKTVLWSSNNENIAVVSDGTVTGKAEGTVTITATTSNNITANCTVTVKEAAVQAQSISLNQNKLLLKKGDAVQLSATVLPDNTTDKTVTWISEDDTIAIVDENGMVEAVESGTVNVIAATANGLKDTCTVTISSATPISNTEELKAIADNLSGDYELTSDIDLSREEWIPIGQNNATPFSGTLDGNGYNIRGLTITDASQIYSGLFGYCSGTVENLTVSGTILAIGDNGNSYRYAGGIAGFAQNATINQCINQVKIQVSNRNEAMGTYVYAGGIAGAVDVYTNFTSCRNETDIIAESSQGTRSDAMAGGIVGNAYNNCTIESCENVGRISASATTTYTQYFISSYAGGIAGAAGLSTINACVNRGEVFAEGTISEKTAYNSMVLAGGIAGHSSKKGFVNGENFAENIQATGSELIPMVYQDPLVAFSLD